MPMRKIAAVFAAIAYAALVSCAASAAQPGDRVDRLLDLLVQKQIITAEEAAGLVTELDAPAAAKAPAPASLPFNASGFMHIAGYWMENDTTQNNDTFRVRHARLSLSGDSMPNMSWKMGVDFANPDPILLDAFVNWKATRRTSISAGQFKLPVSYESIISAKDLDMIDRAQFINQMRPSNGRDIGVNVKRDLAPDTALELGAFNGSGKNNSDTGDPDALTARLTGSYKIGALQLQPEAAFLSAKGETGNATPLETAVNTGAFSPYDKTLKQAGLRSRIGDYTFKAEFMQARLKPKAAAAGAVIAGGRYLQFGVDFMKNYTFFWRHEDYDPNVRTTTATDVTWDTLAVNFRAAKDVVYKLNYLSKKEAAGGEDNDELRLQIMIGF